MVSCASLSSQLVALFGGLQFHHMILKHGAKRYPKAYSSWDHSWTDEGIFFANRMKGNADCATPQDNLILNDSQCALGPADPLQGSLCPKRLPVYPSQGGGAGCLKQTRDRFAHQPSQFGTKTISAIYKDRWQKGLEAEPVDEDLCGNQGERGFHLNLESNDAVFLSFV